MESINPFFDLGSRQLADETKRLVHVLRDFTAKYNNISWDLGNITRGLHSLDTTESDRDKVSFQSEELQKLAANDYDAIFGRTAIHLRDAVIKKIGHHKELNDVRSLYNSVRNTFLMNEVADDSGVLAFRLKM